MIKQEFVQLVEDAVSIGCGLNIKLNAQQLDAIIKRSKNWFYDNYNDAVQREYILIGKRVFLSKEFKSCRKLRLPDCVRSVFMCQETNIGFLGNPDSDFTANKLLLAEIYLGFSDSEALVYRVTQFAFYDLMKQFLLEKIRFSFNKNTKELNIEGRNPLKDVVLEVFTDIPEEDLYNDEKFQRWIIAESKIAAGKIINFIDFPLIGGATINAADLKSEGMDEKAELKEEIKDEMGAPPFMVF